MKKRDFFVCLLVYFFVSIEEASETLKNSFTVGILHLLWRTKVIYDERNDLG